MKKSIFELGRYIPLSCSYYELFELACIRAYHLRILLTQNQEVNGLAHDLKIDDEKSEWLVLTQPGLKIEIRLDFIEQVDVLDEHADFRSLDIKNDSITK